MLKPRVYITGNAASSEVKKELIAVLEKNYYDVQDFHPSGDYVIDTITLAKEIKSDKKRKVGILICNTGISMLNATKFVDGVTNKLVNKQTSLSLLNLGTANMISLGVKEWTSQEIVDISMTFLKEFMTNLEEEELRKL